jgi:uncharacterized protein (DUF1330 family)
MTVYVINNMTIHDMNEYKSYVRAFMPVFEKYGGQVLAAQNKPVPAEGEWPYDRTVLLSMPAREAVERWYQSAEYHEIAKHRWAGTKSNVLFLEALDQHESGSGVSPPKA